MFVQLVLFLAGLVLLTAGAEFLVRGAVRLAIILGVPPIVVGLTIVAYGTSMPELVVSAQAAAQDSADLAVGNVVGSNILNILLILGITSVISPIACNIAFVRREVPIMIGISLLMPLLAIMGRFTHARTLDGGVLVLERWVGFALLFVLAAYSYMTYLGGKTDEGAMDETVADVLEEERKPHGWGHVVLQVALVAIGIVLLVFGARLMVDASISIAQQFGVPELVISLTLVSLGTSLPELATSIVAAIRRQSDISLGNVVGSNIFNVAGVLGISAAIRPLPLGAEVVYRDIPVMIAVAVLCLPVMMFRRRISRVDGICFLALYAAYTVLLFYMTPRA